MNKIRIKYLVDIIPLIIISIHCIVSTWTMFNSGITIEWQHYLGIVFIILTTIALFKNHQLGMLSLGLTLILALTTLISFNVGIVTNSLYITAAKIPVFYGNALSLGWLILHLILSFRYYNGIATQKYWNELFSRIKGTST